MPNIKNRLTNQVVAYDQRQSKLEIAQVDAVHWHKTKNDKDWNVSDIVSRDRRTKAHDPDFSYVRHRVPTIQENGAKFSGTPVNPRRGNAVKALFYKNQKPIILGQVESKFEPPVCRPDPYTHRCKRNQYRPLSQDEDKDFVTDFPDLKKPSCENWQHGPCNGDSSDDGKEPCLGRDWWHVYDFCVEGDKDPSCEKCSDIDYPKRCKNTWLKAYSANTMSCQSPNRRLELHTSCGSYARFEQEQGQSVEYSEGCGHIRIGNATCESSKKGHINFQGSKNAPAGTIDVHSAHEEVPVPNEVLGARMTVVAPDDNTLSDDYGIISAELVDLPTLSVVRIYKNGSIRCRANNDKSEVFLENNGHCWLWNIVTDAYIEMPEDGTVKIHSDVGIILDSPLTHNTNDVQADGKCTHVECDCPCCGT